MQNNMNVDNTVLEEAPLKDRVIAELRGMWGLHEENDRFTCELYADYRDEIDDVTAGKMADADHPMDAFYEQVWEGYFDAEGQERREILNEVVKRLEKDADVFPDGVDEQEVDDIITELVDVCPPYDHYLNQDMYVNISLDTGDCNYDFVLNSVYPCYYGYYNETISDEAGIMWLTRSQGYNKTQLKSVLKNDDVDNPSPFLRSMLAEVANLPNHMSTVTFLVKMTLRDLLELNEAIQWIGRQTKGKYDPKQYPYGGYIVLDKSTMCGLFNPWDGGGSIFEIELEKDVRIPIKYIWRAVPDGCKGHGYNVGDVYGMCGSAWQDTLKAMHIAKKVKEAA